ncbi:MAG: UDP-2,3-diacylglucosamine diphosphatase [Deltaproteobacteria bacterium]|nr:UDP-2,3-diacylglucosamine diphosphatase [Deltaproteobacteria bacterium]
MRAVFIADAHIRGLDDPNQKTLCEFLDSFYNDTPDKVIVLGDLMDFWTGFNDVVYYHYLPLLSALSRLGGKGVEIIYLEGNHDFSMGKFFTDVVRARVYPGACELALDGKRIFLCHGDMVDMRPGYRILRGLLRSVFFKTLTKILPPSVIWKAAALFSETSKALRYEGIERELKKFASTKVLEGYDMAVFGHSHIPALDTEESGKGTGGYANPGSFSADRSYLVYEGGRFRLERYGAGENPPE